MLTWEKMNFYFSFLWLHLQHMEVLRLRVKLEMQLPANAIAMDMAMLDPSYICDPSYSAWSLTHWVRPGIKPASSRTLCWVLNLQNHNGNSFFPDHFLCETYLFVSNFIIPHIGQHFVPTFMLITVFHKVPIWITNWV